MIALGYVLEALGWFWIVGALGQVTTMGAPPWTLVINGGIAALVIVGGRKLREKAGPTKGADK